MTELFPFMREILDSDAPEGSFLRFDYWSVTESGNAEQDRRRGAAYCELVADGMRDMVVNSPTPVLGQPYKPGGIYAEVFFAMAENGQGVRSIEAGFIARAASFAIRADPFGGA